MPGTAKKTAAGKVNTRLSPKRPFLPHSSNRSTHRDRNCYRRPEFLSSAQLKQINAWWRAANHLTAWQLYLLDNPLLERPLAASDLKQTIVGHWGTCPGQNFIYTHLNRVIKKDDLDMIYRSGPGHGGNAMVAQDWLDGSYTEVYPNITQDKDGMKKLFKQFSFLGGVPSHVAPETPGSINEGGELGYSLAHAFGAVADNPDPIAACVVADGEAETGPLATSWHGNKFANPITDGAVLPILHLNGFKIANPAVFSRMSHEEVESFFRGCGWEPRFVEGDEPAVMHQKMAAALDWAIREIKRIQGHARANGDTTRPRWPMIVLRTPKGWTGPKEVNGHPVEGAYRAHQVPISMGADTEKHLPLLEEWLCGYKPEEQFDENGRPVELLRDFRPRATAAWAPTPCQRRFADPGPAYSRLPGVRRERHCPRRRGDAGHAGAGLLRPGCDEAEPGVPELPVLRTGRNGLQPPAPVFEVTGRRFLAPRCPRTSIWTPTAA